MKKSKMKTKKQCDRKRREKDRERKSKLKSESIVKDSTYFQNLQRSSSQNAFVTEDRQTNSKSVQKQRTSSNENTQRPFASSAIVIPSTHHFTFVNTFDVLKGEIALEALDKFSVLAGLIPPQILFLKEQQSESMMNLRIKKDDTAVQNSLCF